MIPLSHLFQELPITSAVSHSSREGNLELLDPALRHAIVDHVPLTAGAPGVTSFKIAVSGVACLKPEIEDQGILICKLSQGNSVNAGTSLSSYSSADVLTVSRVCGFTN